MIRFLALATLAAAAFVTPALAAGPTCSTASVAKFQPKAKLESQLKAAGMTVRQIKTEKGCYEVYAIGKGGKKVNVAYNAETLQQVANPEAGEN